MFLYHDSRILYLFQVHKKKFAMAIWGIMVSVTVYQCTVFVFSVLTRWNRFQIINAFLLESVGTGV